ncbi:MAG: hypothetical protein Kow0077_19980 [Anaerolineae bacterium]
MFMAARFRILCVDDSTEMLRTLQIVLRRAGHQVHTARNGDEAIALLRALSDVDVIIVNARMRGMSGMALVKYIAEESGLDSAGIVLNSPGSVLDLPIQHVAWGRVDVCLPQPFQAVELYDAVFEAFSRRRGYLYRLAL